MSNTFIISDHHLGHQNILSFTNYDGSRVRTFENVNIMDETMIVRHNSVVGHNDKVYFVGDVCFSSTKFHEIMPQLKGEKVLIKGNHDLLKPSAYLQYFKDIRGSHLLDNMLLTHIPVHPDSIRRLNIHGHLHGNRVMKKVMKMVNGAPEWTDEIDPKYYNVCVEHHNFTPVPFETIRAYARDHNL